MKTKWMPYWKNISNSLEEKKIKIKLDIEINKVCLLSIDKE